MSSASDLRIWRSQNARNGSERPPFCPDPLDSKMSNRVLEDWNQAAAEFWKDLKNRGLIGPGAAVPSSADE